MKLRGSGLLRGAVIVLPALTTGLAAARFALLFPYSDDWALVPLLQAWREGHLSFMDFWRQHNEHRIFIAKLIHVPLALAARWDMRPFAALNFAAAAAGWLFLLRLIRREKENFDPAFYPVFLFLAGVSLFSFRQYENWIWASELVCFLAQLSGIAAVCFLSSRRLTGKSFAAAAAFAVMGSFSFAAGLMSWPAGFFVLLLSKGRGGIRMLAVWCGIAAAVFAVWMTGYEQPAHHPGLVFDPRLLAPYFFRYLSSFFTVRGDAALASGAAGFLLFLLLLGRLLFSRESSKNAAAAFSGLSVFSLLNAAVTAVGRAGFGEMQASAPRYAAFSCLFWVGLAGLLLLADKQGLKAVPREDRAVRTRSFRMAAAAVLLILAAAAAGSVQAFPELARLQYRVHKDAVELLDHPGTAALYQVYPDPERIRPFIEKLKDWRFNIFDPSQENRLRHSFREVSRPS